MCLGDQQQRRMCPQWSLVTACSALEVRGLCSSSVGNPLSDAQERAYVTGLRAANMVVDQLGSGIHASILPVEPDEPYIAALKGTAKAVKSGLESLGIRSPFM